MVVWAWVTWRGLDQYPVCKGGATGKRKFQRQSSSEGRNRTQLQVCTPEAQWSTSVTRYGGHPVYLLQYPNDCFRNGRLIQTYTKQALAFPVHDPRWCNQKWSSGILLYGWLREAPLSTRTWRKTPRSWWHLPRGKHQSNIPWIKPILRFMLPLDLRITWTAHSLYWLSQFAVGVLLLAIWRVPTDTLGNGQYIQ